jgi:Domain of unknown function (DUF4336)
MAVKAASALYEPINSYKPLAPHIGIADGPIERVGLFGMKMPWPFTTRMTVVQLAGGDLFLHSPIAFDAALAKRLQSLGRVRHLVSPNRGHYAHIGEWAREFSEAIAWASPGVRERARALSAHRRAVPARSDDTGAAGLAGRDRSDDRSWRCFGRSRILSPGV